MNKLTAWRLDHLQILAVILTVGISWGLNSLDYNTMKAKNVAGERIGPIIQAELSDIQPSLILQQENQWIARFKLSTKSVDPITINGLAFYLNGTLGSQIVRYPSLYPITISVVGNSELSGQGETWIYQDGYIKQEILFNEPVKISSILPLQVDAYVDLRGQSEQSIGLWLSNVITDAIVEGLPVESILLEIHDRF